MVSRYVPDMGDLIWVDFDPTKGSDIRSKLFYPVRNVMA